MSNTAITMSEFVKDFKEAKTDDERAVAIIDFIKQSQTQTKEETLKEISLHDLSTKRDLSELEIKMDGKINIAKWQVIGAMFVFFIAGIAAKHFGF